MSLSRLEPIFTYRSHKYFLLLLAILLLVGLLAGYLLQADYQRQHLYTEQRNIQLEQSIVLLKQKMKTLPVTKIFTPRTVAPVFSVIEVLKKSGGRLINWQPGEPQAKLELLLSWQKVPWFFQHLSYYQDLNLTSFTIAATKDPMVVALTLAFSYENK